MKGNPEVTIAEAARQMGVSPPQVSTLVRRLREEGTVRREDDRFIVVEPAAGAGNGEAAGGAGGAESEVAAQDVQGPGVEGLDAPPVDDETAEAPEAARDEAGRPQAT